MAASSQYYSVSARVGVPSRHEVEVTIPLVGPAGPAGEGGGEGIEVYTVTGATFTVPAVRAARVFIDQSTSLSAANVTINLNLAGPMNLDRVEVILARIQSGFKVTVVTAGYGNYEFYGTQKATFIYSANTAPARWLKAFDNVFQAVAPTTVADIGQPGSIAYANNFLYICVSNNSWRRVAVSEWTTP